MQPLTLAAFAIVNLIWLAIAGVHTGGDTGLYLDGARRLLDGQPLVDREPSYVGYVAVVAACQAIGAGLPGVVLIQIAVATLAARAVYLMGLSLGGMRTATLAGALFTVDFGVNRWHTYVLADSLYISTFALSAWLTYRAAEEPREWRPNLLALLALIAASLIRPEGWFMFAGALLYWVAKWSSSPRARVLALTMVVAALAIAATLVAPRLSGNITAVNPSEMLRRGQTIWGFDGWRVPMPDETTDVGSSGAFAYAVRHPMQTAELMLARVAVHLAHVRPFYSVVHNLAIVSWLLPLYVLTAFAVCRSWHWSLTRWCAIAFGTQALVVALTHADSEGRYLSHAMPLIYPFAAVGLWVIVGRSVSERQVATNLPPARDALRRTRRSLGGGG